MKWWHVLLGLIAIWFVYAFLIPPNLRCKFSFWNKDACQQVQQGSELLKAFGYDIDPTKPLATQSDYTKATGDLLSGIQKRVFE